MRELSKMRSAKEHRKFKLVNLNIAALEVSTLVTSRKLFKRTMA